LVRRVNGTNRDTLDFLGQQIVDQALLFRRRSIARNPELDLNAGDILGRFLSPFTRNDPEIRTSATAYKRRHKSVAWIFLVALGSSVLSLGCSQKMFTTKTSRDKAL
jgi:hypothetical protein